VLVTKTVGDGYHSGTKTEVDGTKKTVETTTTLGITEMIEPLEMVDGTSQLSTTTMVGFYGMVT